MTKEPNENDISDEVRERRFQQAAAELYQMAQENRERDAMTTPAEDALVAEARAAGRRLAALQDELVLQKGIRVRAVAELRALGWSHQQVADALGIARGTAQALANEGAKQT